MDEKKEKKKEKNLKRIRDPALPLHSTSPMCFLAAAARKGRKKGERAGRGKERSDRPDHLISFRCCVYIGRGGEKGGKKKENISKKKKKKKERNGMVISLIGMCCSLFVSRTRSEREGGGRRRKKKRGLWEKKKKLVGPFPCVGTVHRSEFRRPKGKEGEKKKKRKKKRGSLGKKRKRKGAQRYGVTI